MNLEELIKNAKDVKSLDDLVDLAKKEGIDLPVDEAKEAFAKIKETTEDELEEIAGGLHPFSEKVSELEKDLEGKIKKIVK